MNNGLEKIRVIDRAQLSEEHYFQSLLEQARNKGLLRDNDIERMQYDCLTLLAYKTKRYNGGDSSSIRVEKAQDIMTSILFTLGLWLKTYPNPDDAITALQNEPINELYQKGRKRIDTMLVVTKALHGKLLHQLVDTPNVFYRSTLRNGILGFFKLYYPDYSAQEIHITADYPLFNPIPKVSGIEFIRAYLEAAYYENQFCGYFSAADIHHLLCGYEEDYTELLINIYESVLTTTIGCILVGTDVYRLDITETGACFLGRTFVGQSKDEITVVIEEAANELNHRFQFSEGLARYLQSSLPLIASKIETAARGHTLDRIFITPAYPENNPRIIVSYGEKMDDEKYRKVIEEIGQCRFSQDKVAIIKAHIDSLADLEDVLLDADLMEDEVQAILHELSLPEVAALTKNYQLQSDIEHLELREGERLLRERLQCFISVLPPIQQKLFALASKAIQVE